MRQAVALLMMAALLVGIFAATASATPTDSKIIIGAKAQFVSPTTLQVSVTYVCPATGLNEFIGMSVTQADTGAVGSGFLPVACTDERETVVVTVTGVGFQLGQALASGFIGGSNFFGDQHLRSIQIVL